MGTFVVNGKSGIVLSDFNNKYPTIWFTLLHELNYVLFDLIETNSFYLKGNDDLFLIADKAGAFVSEFFTVE